MRKAGKAGRLEKAMGGTSWFPAFLIVRILQIPSFFFDNLPVG
jgi:hypothetical protein